MSAYQIRFQGPCPLLSSFPERPATRHAGTDAAEEDFGVDPLEGFGQNVADIGQVEQEQRHSDDGVEDGRHLAPLGAWRDVSVACERMDMINGLMNRSYGIIIINVVVVGSYGWTRPATS